MQVEQPYHVNGDARMFRYQCNQCEKHQLMHMDDIVRLSKTKPYDGLQIQCPECGAKIIVIQDQKDIDEAEYIAEKYGDNALCK